MGSGEVGERGGDNENGSRVEKDRRRKGVPTPVQDPPRGKIQEEGRKWGRTPVVTPFGTGGVV